MSKGLLAILAWPFGIALAIAWAMAPNPWSSRHRVDHMSERVHVRSSSRAGIRRSESMRANGAAARTATYDAAQKRDASTETSSASVKTQATEAQTKAMDQATAMSTASAGRAASSSMEVGIGPPHIELRKQASATEASESDESVAARSFAISPNRVELRPEDLNVQYDPLRSERASIASASYGILSPNTSFSVWSALFTFVLATFPGMFATARWRRSVVQSRNVSE